MCRWSRPTLCSLWLIALLVLRVSGQETPRDGSNDEEQKQLQIAQRFLSVLEKNPRRGTALDRVYGHHVEFGTLDRFLQQLRSDLEQQPADGSKWMLLGLMESQRGQDAQATEAFQRAETARKNDAMAPYYLAQSLWRTGESQPAIEALERAIAVNPPRADLMEIYQLLGRILQRSQRIDQALEVWKRMETAFPNEPRVLEQIAVILNDEGQPSLALPRYEKLAQVTRDDYRRTMYRISVAELKIKTKQRDEGIRDFEAILSDIKPESWIYRDVRRRIEEVFLRSSDQDSLVQYYQTWLTQHPQDIEVMSRLAKFLANSARMPEAVEWMEKAIKLAPSRSDLRRAFIDQLVDNQEISLAIAQYKALSEANPSNTDYLRDWGKLVLRDKSLDETMQRSEAKGIWNRIVGLKAKDPVQCTQVADLFRNANFKDEATALYEKAVELAPNDPQYREYLGEYYHLQNRKDEAMRVWLALAAPPNRSAANVERLAEVLKTFGYTEESAREIADACRLAPKDFALHVKAANIHSNAGQFDQAIAFLDKATSLAATDDERSEVVKQRIDILQSHQKLQNEIDRLRAEIAATNQSKSESWHLLARYLESDRDWSSAKEAIDRAIELEPQSIPFLITAQRIIESSGDLGASADICRKLAQMDRRSRDDHLRNVSRLESQLGRAEQALKAAHDLILAGPSNTDNYEFLAQLCFRLGRNAEGLEALRKAVRINPNEPKLMMALGAALGEQLETREAIELYWRAFDKSEELDDKTSLMMKITPLYEQLGQFDQLKERLERERKEDDKRRVMTICLAQAYQSAGDIYTARTELESLITTNSRDTNLLQQISKLCQTSGELDAAVGYQRQLVSIAPGHETEYPLATLLNEAGQREEASDILVKLALREQDPMRLMRNIDSLLTQDNASAALKIISPLVTQRRDDWELVYREGVAWANLGKNSEAATRFQKLLSFQLPMDEMGQSALARWKQAQQKAKSDNLRGIRTAAPTRQSPLQMLNMVSSIQQATGITRERIISSTPQPVWMPDYFGTARMASYGWLIRFEQDAKLEKAESNLDEKSKPKSADLNESELATSLAEQAKSTNASRNSVFNWLFVSKLRNKNDDVFAASKMLFKQGSTEEASFFLTSMASRELTVEQRSSSSATKPRMKPLAREDIESMLAAFELLLGKDTSSDAALVNMSQIAYSSTGQAFVMVGNSYRPLNEIGAMGSAFTGQVLQELRNANQNELAEEVFQKIVNREVKALDISRTILLLANEKKWNDILPRIQKWQVLALKEIRETPLPSLADISANQKRSYRLNGLSIPIKQLLSQLAKDEEHKRILEVLDQLAPVAAQEQLMDREINSLLSKRRNTSQSTPQFSFQTQIYDGEKQNTQQFDAPISTTQIRTEWIGILRQAYQAFKKANISDDLVSFLKKRLENSQKETQFLDLGLLATVQWWEELKDEAVEGIFAMANDFPNDIDFQFQLAELASKRNDFQQALDIVDKIPPSNQQIVQRRERVVLSLTERLGDSDRAAKAAERLFGMRMNASQQTELIGTLRRLGLENLAEALLARAERSAGNQVGSQANLMLLYQGQGKTEQAKELARSVLRRTPSPISQLARSNNLARGSIRMGSNTGMSGNERSQAIQVLRQTGELSIQISQLESQLEKKPNATQIVEQLIEFYESINERNKLMSALQKGIEQRPNALALRVKIAQIYSQSGKLKEACDEYLYVIKQRPSIVADEFYQVNQIFRQAKRSEELLNAVESIDLRQFGHPYYLIDVISQSLQQNSGSTVAGKLLTRIVDAFPSYRSNIMSRFYDESIWKNEKMFDFLLTSVIPTETQVRQQPWYGLDTVNSVGQGGEAIIQMERVKKSLPGNRSKQLEEALRKGTEDFPDWKGGRAILAILRLQEGASDAKNELAELVRDETSFESMPVETAWFIGQSLDRYPEHRDLAIKALEKAIPARASSQMEYSPVIRLINLDIAAGQIEKARERTKNYMNLNLQNQSSDPQYQSYLAMENALGSSKVLQRLGLHADVVKICQHAFAEPEKMKMAGQYRSSEDSYYKKQLTQLLETALTKIKAEASSVDIATLIEVNKNCSPSIPAIELLVTKQKAGTGPVVMVSQLVEVLRTLKDQTEVVSQVANQLNQICEQFPNDLSAQIALALHRKVTGSEKWKESLERIHQIIESNPLEQIPVNRWPNGRQRSVAVQSVPLWLVARETIGTELWKPLGEKMAQRALDAALRQVNLEDASAIAASWSVAIHESDKLQAEKVLTTVLGRALQRPKSNASENRSNASMPASVNSVVGSNPAQPGLPTRMPVTIPTTPANRSQSPANIASPPSTRTVSGAPTSNSGAPTSNSGIPQDTTKASVAPLTKSQFTVAVEVAKNAASLGFSELAKRAIVESVRGGMPVNDLVDTSNQDPFAPRLIRSSSSTAPSNDALTEDETFVGTLLLNNIEQLQLDPSVSFEIAKQIVLPAERKNSVNLFEDAKALSSGTTRSLAEYLVRIAAKQNRLDELDQELVSREKGASLLASQILRAHIAIERADYELAKMLITDLEKKTSGAVGASSPLRTAQIAMRAFDVPELKENASSLLYNLVLASAKDDSRQNTNTENRKLSDIESRLIQYYADKNQTEKIKQFFEESIATAIRQYANYSGGYGIFQQQIALAKQAEQAASLGMLDLALEFLGRSLDFEQTEYGTPSTQLAHALIACQMKQQSPADQYRKWFEWTLPTPTRRTIRAVVNNTSITPIPALYASKRFDVLAGKSLASSNLSELVQLARELNCLDELRTRVEQAANEKIPNADALQDLLRIQNLSNDQIEGYFNELVELSIPRNSSNEPKRNQSEAIMLQKRIQLNSAHLIGNRLVPPRRLDLIAFLVRANPTAIPGNSDSNREFELVRDLLGKRDTKYFPIQLQHWIHGAKADLQPSADSSNYTRRHAASPGLSWFKYPMIGDVKIDVENKMSSVGTTASFGGLLFQESNNYFSISIVGSANQTQFPTGLQRESFGPMHATVIASNSTLKYELQSQRIVEEETSSTCPWLGLRMNDSGDHLNIKLSGDFEVPNRVAMLMNDRMDGWACMLNETQPIRRLLSKRVDNSIYRNELIPDLETLDWSTKDSILTGQAVESSKKPSWITYVRPIEAGERFEFEFYFENGKSLVSPSLGQIAFVLSPEGVKSRWVEPEKLKASIFGIDPDHLVDDNLEKNVTPKFKEKDWNHVVLELNDGEVSLQLNGLRIYRRATVDTTDFRVGLFRIKKDTAKVRNAYLSGNWKEAFAKANLGGSKANVLEPHTSKTDDQLLIESLIGSRDQFNQDVKEIVEKSRAMNDIEATQFLAAHILPSKRRATFACGLEWQNEKTSHPYASLDRFVSPAFELMDRAKKANQLDAVEKSLNDVAIYSQVDARYKQALQCMIALTRKNESQAIRHMQDMFVQLGEGLTVAYTMSDRLPELLVALASARNSTLWPQGLSMARKLESLNRGQRSSLSPPQWSNLVSGGYGAIESAWIHGSRKEMSNSRQWLTAAPLSPNDRAKNSQPVSWYFDRGQFRLIPGQATAQCFFQSPLRGQFELVGRISTHGYRETSVAYGMHSAEPKHDLTAIQNVVLGKDIKDLGDALKIPAWDTEAVFRIVIDGTKKTTYVNGTKVHEENFDLAPDPWVVIQPRFIAGKSTIRDLRILGSPEIPKEIDLSNSPKLMAWRSLNNIPFLYNNDGNSRQNELWEQAGKELIGNSRKVMNEVSLECALQYSRPMFEDGQFEYEFYYERGVQQVHPTLGTVAYLIDQDQLSVHTLTNTVNSNLGLRSDNATHIDTRSKINLKDKDWNSVLLDVRGDNATLSVNGVEIATLSIEDQPQARFFGFFRYANKTEGKIRNIKYRGNWPTNLPSIEEQELASPADGIQLNGDRQSTTYRLGESAELLQKSGFQLLGQSSRRKINSNDIQLSLENDSQWNDWSGLSLPMSGNRDVSITVDYENFEADADQGWGTALCLELEFQSPARNVVEVSVSRNGKGEAQHRAQGRHGFVDDSVSESDGIQLTGFSPKGQLRLVRKGGQVYCMVKPAEAKKWETIHSIIVGDLEMHGLQLQLRASEGNSKATVNLINLQIDEYR